MVKDEPEGEALANSSPDISTIKKRPQCGLVMPISEIDGCNEAHWLEVKAILTAAVDEAGFDAELVSVTDEAGVIQGTIIQNLYENDVIVCDVSGKNPNVMFELGMRLAFDKPTVIVKDDHTSYSFDTSPIEHVAYRRDLRYSTILSFRNSLSKKVRATYDSATTPHHTTFLKHFGKFSVAKLATEEVSPERFVMEELKSLKLALDQIGRQVVVLATRGPNVPVHSLGSVMSMGTINSVPEITFSPKAIESFVGQNLDGYLYAQPGRKVQIDEMAKYLVGKMVSDISLKYTMFDPREMQQHVMELLKVNERVKAFLS